MSNFYNLSLSLLYIPVADRVIVYDGSPGRDCVAHTPVSLMEGMNKFLKNLEITCKSLLMFLLVHFAAESVPLDIVFQQGLTLIS